MPGLNAISQSHFAVLFADNVANNPIQRMPVYAEIAITETLGRTMISAADLQLHDDRYGDWTRQALSRVMDQVSFAALTKSQKAALQKVLDDALSDSEFAGMSEKKIRGKYSPAELDKKFEELVLKALNKAEIAFETPQIKKIVRAHPLGYISTDHVGYASFDLRNFQKSNVLHASQDAEYAFYVYPMAKEEWKMDALAQARITNDAVFAKFSINSPTVMNDMRALNMTSMQNPSLIDWYLSPSSFSVNPSYFIGQDGCENLFPANFATSEFRFFQVARGEIVQEAKTREEVSKEQKGQEPVKVVRSVVEISPKIRVGRTLEYKTTWQPLGHTLGSIIYSLPLAPGEIVKIAVIDWQRKSQDFAQ